MTPKALTSTDVAGTRSEGRRSQRGRAASRRLGQQTFVFERAPVVISSAAIGGPMEKAGPLGDSFDATTQDELLGKKCWEEAEMQLMKMSTTLAIEKAGLKPHDVDLMFAGDLLNQIICCNFAARDLDIPFFGLFSACATFAEGLVLASMALDGGYATQALVATCSHNKTAERQYRFPTELGTQRPPTAQWTVTGSGAVMLSNDTSLPGARITHGTVGRVVDIGLKDPFDMGSAMAPAAVATIRQHLSDTRRRFDDYDLVVTGDLARVGSDIARDLFEQAGIDTGDRYQDCGVLMYDPKRQDVHSGGSGTACSSTVFAGHLLEQLASGQVRSLLLAATGALMSPTSYQQGHTIPTIAHAVSVEYREG